MNTKKRAPLVAAVPQTAYVLRLSAASGVGVESFEDAARAFAPFVGRGSAFYARRPELGAILDRTGRQVAHVSPNGRVWPGAPRDWTPGAKPLCEAAGR